MFFILTAVVVVLVLAYYITDFVLRSLKVDKFTDKYVLITGCDTGFGHLAAMRLDTLGFHVFAGCLTKDGAKSLSETCSSRLNTLLLDVTNTESIEQAVQFVKRKLPAETGLWALINNAGIVGLLAPVELCAKEHVLAAFNVNLLGMTEMIRHFLPLLRKSKGRIVNTSSVCGRVAFVPYPYTASKYAIEGCSDLLRREVRHQGIKVSIVEPGAFKTPIFDVDKIVADVQKVSETCSPEVQAAYGGNALLKKLHEAMTHLKETGTANIGLVVDAYILAISSKFPRTRYVVGSDARWFYIPISYLPAGITDFIFS